ncbi:MAG: hypothetical protein IT210_09220 [Armatimonadetes bacterium]|nr:hypothetical protein [Armatimonadota bacterium]
MKACRQCGQLLDIRATPDRGGVLRRLPGTAARRWGYVCPSCQAVEDARHIGVCYACRLPLDLDDLHTLDWPQGSTIRIIRRWDFEEGVVASAADYYHLECYNHLPSQPLDAPYPEAPFPLSLMLVSMTSLGFFFFSGNLIRWIIWRTTLP